MKLSEIRGEKAIELLGDILIPATEIMADPKISSAVESGKPKLTIVTNILKNHSKSILTILALLNQEDPASYNPSLFALPKMAMDILEDEELMDLFRSQGQLKEDESSVSALENIAE